MTRLRPQQAHDLSDRREVQPLGFRMRGTLLIRLTVKTGEHLGLQMTQILTHDCLTCRNGN